MRLVQTEDLGIVFEEANEEIPAQLGSIAVGLAHAGDVLAKAAERSSDPTIIAAAKAWEKERERQQKLVASSWAGTLAANTERLPGASVFAVFRRYV